MFNKSAKCHLVTYSEFVCLIHSESKQTQMLQFETEKVLFQSHTRRQFVYAAPPNAPSPTNWNSSKSFSKVVMYGCESWTIKRAERRIIDAFELWCWRRLLIVPWIARRFNQSILKEISPGCSLEGLMLKLKL